MSQVSAVVCITVFTCFCTCFCIEGVAAPAAREVTLEPTQGAVAVTLAAGAVTSVRFDQAIDTTSITLGSGQFVAEVASERQINLRLNSSRANGASEARTNVNLVTKAGRPIVLALSVAAKGSDGMVSIHVSATGDACGEPIEAARRDTVSAAEGAWLRDATKRLAARHVDARAVQDGIILKVLDVVRIGDRGLVRFAVHNRSRLPWIAGDVALSVEVAGAVIEMQATTFIATPSIARDEETLGAVLVLLPEVPEDARFALQVSEKGGTRNPAVSNLAL